MYTREGLGEFSTVMQTRDEVERGWDNSRQLGKPETKSRILPNPRVLISGFITLMRVCMRVCKHACVM